MLTPLGEDLDRALDHTVGTTMHRDGGSAMSEEIVNAQKTTGRRRIERLRCPPQATVSLTATRIGLPPRVKYEPARGHVIPSPPLPSIAVSATVQNVLERIVRPAALIGLMTGLA